MNKAINKEVFNAILRGVCCRYTETDSEYAITADGAKLLIIKKSDFVINPDFMKKTELSSALITVNEADKELFETGRIFKKRDGLCAEYEPSDKSFKVYIDKALCSWHTASSFMLSECWGRVLVLDFITRSPIGCVMPIRFTPKEDNE